MKKGGKNPQLIRACKMCGTVINNLNTCNWSPKRKRERQWCRKTCEEIAAENFPKLMKDINPRNQGIQKIPKRKRKKETWAYHSQTNKIKDKTLKMKGYL